MAETKYLLDPTSWTDDNGNRLYQLWADRDFRTARRGVVRRGERGGLVGRNSLSHEGGCWVEADGVVRPGSRVEGDAYVSSHATLLGNSLVRGRALVGDGVRLESTIMDGDTEVMGGHTIVVRSIVEGAARIWSANVIDCWLTGTAMVVGPGTTHSLKIHSERAHERGIASMARDDRDAACRRAIEACRRERLDPQELQRLRMERLANPSLPAARPPRDARNQPTPR